MILINNIDEYPKELKARIQKAIDTIKPHIIEEIGGDGVDHDNMNMVGWRVYDDERIIYGVCGEIGDPNVDVPDSEVNRLTEYTIRDYAGADYWYTYEKQWD